MDFKELSRVADTLDGKVKSVSGQGLEVQESENPLDALEVRAKVTDSAKVKVLILDSQKIKSIMEGSREDKRKFLAKLTDSQRRRVLQVYQDSKKIKDGFVDKLALYSLDEALANFIFSPTPYNKEILQENLESKEFSDDVKNLITLVINDEFDYTIEDHREIWDSFLKQLENVGLESSSAKALETMSISDSVRVSDSALTEDIAKDIAEAAVADLNAWDGKDYKTLQNSSEKSIDMFVVNGHDINEVSEVYWKSISEEKEKNKEQEIEDHLKIVYNISLEELKNKVTDGAEEALDEIEDKPFINEEGEQVTGEDKTPILTLLNEALNSFAEGDPSKLEELSTKTLSDEPEEESDETEPEGEPEEESDDIKLEDAVNLAKSILAKENVNKIIDGLAEKVQAFKKYNFKVTDCEMCTEVAPATETIDVPLTCEEYNAVVPKSNLCFEQLISQASAPLCPHVQDVWTTADHLCLQVNSAQTYVPIGISADELYEIIQNTPNTEWTRLINEYCKPLDVVLATAAVTDNLNLIDNKFYKKHLKDEVWSFDQCPKVLEGLGVESGTIRICKDSSITEGAIDIFGQNYRLV